MFAETANRLDEQLARIEQVGVWMRREGDAPSTTGGKLGLLLKRLRSAKPEGSWSGVWQRLADLTELQASLLRRESQEQQRAAEWERRAMLCVHAGDDATARQALHRRREHLAVADELTGQAAALEAVIDVLERGAAEIERAATG